MSNIPKTRVRRTLTPDERIIRRYVTEQEEA